MFKTLAIVFVICFGISNAEVVKFEPCDSNPPAQCTVHEVRVNPCPEAANNSPCIVKWNKPSTVEFEYTTEWDSTSAHGQAYAIIEDADVPFLTMNTNACEHTTCPITKSTRHTYTYSLTVASKTPTKQYTVKWVLRNPDEPENSEQQCCFMTKVRLQKR